MPPLSRLFDSFILAMVSLLGVKAYAADDSLARVRKAVERSALDQPGTHAFHLVATVAPSNARDKDSSRTGDIEIWWSAPGVYRREVNAPGFHQLEIVNGGKVWQKNEGDYFPNWLRMVAETILRPLPESSEAFQGIKPDIERALGGSTYLGWEKPLPMTQQPAKENVALTDNTGLFFYDGGLGWGALFKDYTSFHGREIPRTIMSGTPEVMAKIVVLEDLPAVTPNWFDVAAAVGGTPRIDTVVVDNAPIGPDLGEEVEAPAWPTVTNTPLKGVVWTVLVLDRNGKVREPFSVISDNPAINDVAHAYFASLRFKPTLRDGVPVQVVRRIARPFDLKRPEGVEDLGTARNAFEAGRRASTLSAAATSPYLLKASFSMGMPGGPAKGTYVDTWVDAHHWRREVVVADSHAIRSLDGEQQYLLLDGPNAKAARLALGILEPIPAADTMTESDWRLKRDSVNGTPTVRVMRGDLAPGATLDPKKDNAYWFDSTGHLVEAYSNGLALAYTAPEDFEGVALAHSIVGTTSTGGTAILIHIDEARALDPASLQKNVFKLKGHEWKRQFTSETR